MTRIGVMQPYVYPYKGYFELIKSVDKFVVYDDAQYIKGGWINRNMFPEPFTFRVKRHPFSALINECYFMDIEEDKKDFLKQTKLHAEKYLNPMKQEYSVAFNNAITLVTVCEWMGIHTPFYLSSEMRHGKFADGVIDIVKYLGGDTYVNLPGGKKLYNQEMFGDIKLEFIETVPGPSILVYLERMLL
jgi:hypothetical protein